MTTRSHAASAALLLFLAACGQADPAPPAPVAAAPAPVPAPVRVEVPALPVAAAGAGLSSLKLRMLGSIVRADAAASTALVSVNDGAPQEFGTGAELVPGMRIESIASDALTVSDGTQRRRVVLEAAPAQGAGAAPGANGAAAAASHAPVPQPGDLEDVFRKALKEQLGPSAGGR